MQVSFFRKAICFIDGVPLAFELDCIWWEGNFSSVLSRCEILDKVFAKIYGGDVWAGRVDAKNSGATGGEGEKQGDAAEEGGKETGHEEEGGGGDGEWGMGNGGC